MSQFSGLTSSGCRARQERLRQELVRLDLDAAYVTDPRHVHYLTGFWARPLYAPTLLLPRDGESSVVLPFPATEVTADQVLLYTANQIGTLVEDQVASAAAVISSRLVSLRRIGIDAWPPLSSTAERVDLGPTFRQLRRRKDEDEVAILRHAIVAAEAAYQFAFDNLKAGADELDLYAGMLAAATRSAGEPIGEFGNDFQVGSPGGPPRPGRRAQAGELGVFDLSVCLRGYRCDLCRSFAVDHRPSPAQVEAQQRIEDVFGQLETMIRPGVSCREVFDHAKGMLDGWQGWSFPHHLGHGIGLDAHESPRINPHWDDVFAEGDVITLEPGLYGPGLAEGMRIEDDYRITATGLERLSRFSRRLT